MYNLKAIEKDGSFTLKELNSEVTVLYPDSPEFKKHYEGWSGDVDTSKIACLVRDFDGLFHSTWYIDDNISQAYLVNEFGNTVSKII